MISLPKATARHGMGREGTEEYLDVTYTRDVLGLAAHREVNK